MLFSINQEKSIRHILNILLVLIITNADVAAQEMADTTFKKMEIVQDSVVGKDMESILLSSSNEEKAVEAKPHNAKQLVTRMNGTSMLTPLDVKSPVFFFSIVSRWYVLHGRGHTF